MIQPICRWPNLVALLLLIVASGAFAVHRSNDDSRQAMAASDRAFDVGDLKRSTLEARSSAMSALPKSTHLRASLERLSAIAVGSESAGRLKTALVARMSLLSLVQSRSAKVDPSLGPQSSEQIRFLIDKVAPAKASESVRSDWVTLAVGSSPGPVSMSLFFVALAATAFNRERLSRLARNGVAVWVLPVAAILAWFGAWFSA